MVQLGLCAMLRHVAAMAATFTISPASSADAGAVAAIYAHHVLHGTATFETAVPDATEIAARMAKLHEAKLPWLVARRDGEVLGYAYAAPFHSRAAYHYTCEDSIYIDHRHLGQGLGKALLGALLDASAAAGMRQMIALIAGTEPASLALHERFGFARCGELKSVGRKHGTWLDVIYMQRALGAGDITAPRREPD
jgi:L-amino acid N-acyltransferase YncA